MTGARLHVVIDDKAITEPLRRLGAVAAERAGLMRAIGVGLVEATQSRFESQTTPDGTPWKPLNPGYAAGKRGPGILRESGMRGGLQGSITFQTRGGLEVEVGSNKVYAAIHQFGGVITAKTGRGLVFKIGGQFIRKRSVTIPARPYLGFGAADQAVVEEVIEIVVSRALSR